MLTKTSLSLRHDVSLDSYKDWKIGVKRWALDLQDELLAAIMNEIYRRKRKQDQHFYYELTEFSSLNPKTEFANRSSQAAARRKFRQEGNRTKEKSSTGGCRRSPQSQDGRRDWQTNKSSRDASWFRAAVIIQTRQRIHSGWRKWWSTVWSSTTTFFYPLILFEIFKGSDEFHGMKANYSALFRQHFSCGEVLFNYCFAKQIKQHAGHTNNDKCQFSNYLSKAY